MSRRRTAESDDSLELLLDTVCNAFGGIIFIVLLLVILPSRSAVESMSPLAQASRAQTSELARLTDEVAHAQKLLAVQEQTLGAMAVEDPSDDQRKRRELDARRRVLTDEVAAAQRDDARLAAGIDARTREVQALQDVKRRLSVGLIRGQEEAARQEVRVTRLPRLRAVEDKVNYFVVLSGGRVYLIRRPGNASLQVFDNEDDFDVTRSPRVNRYVPRAAGGVDADAWLASGEFARLRDQAPPARVVVSMAVYADSLPAFAKVRNAFTGAGYDYNWYPFARGEPVLIVKTNESPSAQ